MADSGSLGGHWDLGSLFALSFCPVSAALFFGSLIPLALKTKGGATRSALLRFRNWSAGLVLCRGDRVGSEVD